ncbi:MAG: S-methyl-5-thioribose-1-phosphate isomerase [Acidobacteria bacterium]|nr:S-methyl-5-thioribose-1-phosphate isomerase [Acidobacteriota bacterium]
MTVDAGTTTRSEPFSPIRWQDDTLYLLDQTLLPAQETWVRCDTTDLVADAIYRLAVRGAPAIGVAAGYGLVVGLMEESGGSDLEARFRAVSDQLRATRPTAVNLAWALDRGRRVFDEARSRGLDRDGVIRQLLEWATELHRDDIATNLEIGRHGATLFRQGDRVLTHCNAGTLATAGYGTAVGVIQSSWEGGKVSQVWVDETRPLLQGARLTAWELKRLGIPFRVVTDSSAGALMARGLVDRIVVGADRIAANGDAANKIGTYTVAVLAHRHGIPFYVAAPLSTIDRATATGADIPIEERRPTEVTSVLGTAIAPEGADALNLAFDVTPSELVAAIITEKGVLTAPYEDSIRRAFEQA